MNNMKQKKIKNVTNSLRFFSIVFLFMSLVNCEDFRMNKMVDDQVYLLKNGFVEKKIYTLEKSTLDVYVIKSGVGQRGAEIELLINDDILQEYNLNNNTSYQVLPSDCYSLVNNSLKMEKDDYKVFFQFELNIDKIRELQEKSEETFIIPCKLNVLSADISISDPKKSVALIAPTIIFP